MNHNNKNRKKRLAIDKKSAILDINGITRQNIQLDLVGDENDNDLFIITADLSSPAVKESIGTDILQKLKRTISGSEK